MSSELPEEKIIAGVTKGVLEYTEEKIKDWITRFKNRELAFIDDTETITLAKIQRETPEWDLFKKYVDAYNLRILFLMGLTLRALEKQGKPLNTLKKTIHRTYGNKGLHISYFVQNGFFQRFLASILEREQTSEKLKTELLNLFINIENVVVFIPAYCEIDEMDRITKQIITKINANSPRTFIISSIGRAARNCAKVQKKVMNEIEGYNVESNKTQDRTIYFLNKEDSILKQ